VAAQWAVNPGICLQKTHDQLQNRGDKKSRIESGLVTIA
jgi:hypothetical protein